MARLIGTLCRRTPPTAVASRALQRRRRLQPAACMWLLLAVGCATVDHRPFETFAQTAQALQTNAGKALEASPAAARERYIEAAVDDPNLLDQLRLGQTGNPLIPTTTDAPLFLHAEQFRVGVQRVAGVFTAYAQLLLQLASPDLLSQASFDSLASDLNANAFDAVTAIGGPPSGATSSATSGIALLSTAATAIFQAYLEDKRRDKLVEALAANQQVVADYADLLVGGVNTAARLAWQEYNLQIDGTLLRAARAEDGDRRAAIEESITLNSEHLTRLEILGALSDAFAALPDAHVALVEAARNPETGIGAINTAMAGAQRLEAIFDRSVLANQASAAQSLADEAAETPLPPTP